MRFALAGVFLFALATSTFALTPTDLRCNYAVHPLNMDSASPRLFWKFESKERGARQSAYEILVASSKENLSKNKGDLWDSGKVDSEETIQIQYAGSKLKSWQQVFWKVRAWDQIGKASKWSQPASWTMGVLKSDDWHAHWISAPETNLQSTLLRREFAVKPGLKRALVNICGLGQYELTLNGNKVGNDFLSPGWSKYNKTCLYDTRDITALLRRGKNAVGFCLGNGMYNVERVPGRFTKFARSFGAQKAIAQIRLEYTDGSVEFIGTDETWEAAPGPITFSSIYGGEDFDARLVQPGWNEPGLNVAQTSQFAVPRVWKPALLVSGPGGELRGLSCSAPPIRAFGIHRPISSRTLTNGDIVYDLGQNAAHIPKITVSGPAGTKVRLIPSELTNEDGSANQSSMGGGHRGYVWCEFTKGTDGEETWSPKFFYVGCRYIQVHFDSGGTGVPPVRFEKISSPKEESHRQDARATPRAGATPALLSLEGIVIHSDCEPVGEFNCSNDLFNRTFNLVRWAQQNNMVSVMTDCPHRERLGWLEEDHLNGPALRYDFNLAQLFTKMLNDIADSQLTNGLVPTTAPEYAVFRDKSDTNHLRNNFGDSPAWSSTFILVPWQQYEFDGDLNLFRKHYDGMKDYLAYLGSRATNDIVNYGLGDWYDLGPNHPGVSQLTPIALTGTAFYFEDAKIMARAAELLGKPKEARKFGALSESIRAAFNQQFFDPTNDTYATGSQCANSIPLVFGICEPSNRNAVVDAIVRDVRKNGLTAGDVGYRYLLRALADGGRSDVIFEMNNQTNQPGYGMQLAKGKTSLTEAWDGGSSQDHFMLGQIQEWFYHDLAGIQNAPNSAGFKRIVIAPQPVGDLKWVNARYDSIRGKIVSDWKRDGSKFTLKVTIPPNTTATVFFPAKSADAVKKSREAKFLRMENGCAVFAVPSGSYRFRTADLH